MSAYVILPCGGESENAVRYYPSRIHAHADDVHRDYVCVHVQEAHVHDCAHEFL